MAKCVVQDDVQKLNIRNAMSTAPGTDDGDLFPGDVVYGTVLGNWVAFDKVYRKSGGVDAFAGKRYAAIANPLNLNDLYMTITNDTEPVPNPNPGPVPSLPSLTISVDSPEYEIVKITDRSVEVRPKV